MDFKGADGPQQQQKIIRWVIEAAEGDGVTRASSSDTWQQWIDATLNTVVAVHPTVSANKKGRPCKLLTRKDVQETINDKKENHAFFIRALAYMHVRVRDGPSRAPHPPPIPRARMPYNPPTTASVMPDTQKWYGDGDGEAGPAMDAHDTQQPDPGLLPTDTSHLFDASMEQTEVIQWEDPTPVHAAGTIQMEPNEDTPTDISPPISHVRPPSPTVSVVSSSGTRGGSATRISARASRMLRMMRACGLIGGSIQTVSLSLATTNDLCVMIAREDEDDGTRASTRQYAWVGGPAEAHALVSGPFPIQCVLILGLTGPRATETRAAVIQRVNQITQREDMYVWRANWARMDATDECLSAFLSIVCAAAIEENARSYDAQ